MWVKSHSDKKPWKSIEDLKNQGLSRDQIYNVWYDYIAGLTWSKNTSTDDPEVTQLERWALYASYPTPHKIIGNLTRDIYSTVGYQDLLSYLTSKYNIHIPVFHKVNHNSLASILTELKPNKRSSLVKLIHGWNPTYSGLCRQGREQSPLCPWCQIRVKTEQHIRERPNKGAISFRQTQLKSFLIELERTYTAPYLIRIFEYKLSLCLNVPYHPTPDCTTNTPLYYSRIITATRHQNLIGWDMFLKGFTFIYWHELQTAYPSPEANVQHWDFTLVRSLLKLYTSIWDDRNAHIHGFTKEEAQTKLRERVIKNVMDIYNFPPKLHTRFPKVDSVPLQIRLRQSTTSLQRWMVQLKHQAKVSESLFTHASSTQLTLHQAFKGKTNSGDERKKFPPYLTIYSHEFLINRGLRFLHHSS